jgi:hypothetical protein
MTKLNEKMHYDEDNEKIIIEQKHDYTPILNKTAQMRSDGATDFGESKLVGVIPMKMWAEWAKKWGVKPSDTNGMKEVVARELADPDNAAFRVWGGKF